MGLGRRKVRVSDPEGWVFNKMADVYDARPPYPSALVDALSEFCSRIGPRVCELGAGMGHLALPLAARGFSVIAVEPAHAMLERLSRRAREQKLELRAIHATAEQLPLDDGVVDVALIADALHFLDAELTGRELRRVLAPRAALALVTCALGDTPFMRAVVEVMADSAPRKPRQTEASLRQVAALAEVVVAEPLHFRDDVSVDRAALDRILRSISFIGPAMNEERAQSFRSRIHALSLEPVWSRTFTLHLMQTKR
jgi:ubiquinone/menaquinone biosynthesis C-methylase UbiE